MATFNRDFAARVLVDAFVDGDTVAAKKHKIATKTVSRYRQRLAIDPALSAIVQRLQHSADREWRAARVNSLRKNLAKLDELVAMATGPEQIPLVVSAIQTVGELQISADALNVDTEDDRQGARTAGVAAEDSPAADSSTLN